MRKPYNRILKKRFAEMVGQVVPPFQAFKGKSAYIFPCEYAYVHCAAESIWLFLVLFINPKGRESFTLEFGWSLKGRFPEVLSIDFLDMEPERRRFVEEEYIQRIGVFRGRDTWWFVEDEEKSREYFQKHFSYPAVTPEQAEAAVNSAMEDVKQLLEAKVLPYLREFVETVQNNNRVPP